MTNAYLIASHHPVDSFGVGLNRRRGVSKRLEVFSRATLPSRASNERALADSVVSSFIRIIGDLYRAPLTKLLPS